MTRASGTDEGKGFCPVCGAEVQWIATSHLWPSRRAAREVLPSQSGTCTVCGRVLVFTVLNESAHDARSGLARDAGIGPAGDSGRGPAGDSASKKA